MNLEWIILKMKRFYLFTMSGCRMLMPIHVRLRRNNLYIGFLETRVQASNREQVYGSCVCMSVFENVCGKNEHLVTST